MSEHKPFEPICLTCGEHCVRCKCPANPTAPERPRTTWLATRDIPAYSNPTESTLYPHAFTALVPLDSYIALERERDSLRRDVELFRSLPQKYVSQDRFEKLQDENTQLKEKCEELLAYVKERSPSSTAQKLYEKVDELQAQLDATRSARDFANESQRLTYKELETARAELKQLALRLIEKNNEHSDALLNVQSAEKELYECHLQSLANHNYSVSLLRKARDEIVRLKAVLGDIRDGKYDGQWCAQLAGKALEVK